MKLYYTASQPGVYQDKVTLSIGGYRSLSEVTNEVLGNFFSGISLYTIKSGQLVTYIGLILENNSGIDYPNVYIYFDYPQDFVSRIKIAAVDVVTDSDGEKYIERTSNVYDKPRYAEFHEADSYANKVNIGSIARHSTVGLFFQRTIDPTKVKLQGEQIYESDTEHLSMFREIIPNKREDIKFSIITDYEVAVEDGSFEGTEEQWWEEIISGNFIFNEIPSGDIDGINREFTSANPFILETLQVFVNGIRQSDEDYTISDNTIIFNFSPEEGEDIFINYQILN